MADFLFATACNRPRLHDAAALAAVLQRYYFDLDLTVEIETDPWTDHEYLAIQGDGWPGAWEVPDPLPDDWEPNFEGDGGAGFEGLLQEIALHLAEPLIVQALGTIKGRFPLSACEWRVEPDACQLDVTNFSLGQTDLTLTHS